MRHQRSERDQITRVSICRVSNKSMPYTSISSVMGIIPHKKKFFADFKHKTSRKALRSVIVILRISSKSQVSLLSCPVHQYLNTCREHSPLGSTDISHGVIIGLEDVCRLLLSPPTNPSWLQANRSNYSWRKGEVRNLWWFLILSRKIELKLHRPTYLQKWLCRVWINIGQYTSGSAVPIPIYIRPLCLIAVSLCGK